MLVLSRHRDESIRIGDNISVTLIDIRGDKVRLGVEAPCDIPVHRQEVYEAICREQKAAPAPKPCDVNAELLEACKAALALLDKQRKEHAAALNIMPRPYTCERGPIANALATAIRNAESRNPKEQQ